MSDAAPRQEDFIREIVRASGVGNGVVTRVARSNPISTPGSSPTGC